MGFYEHSISQSDSTPYRIKASCSEPETLLLLNGLAICESESSILLKKNIFCNKIMTIREWLKLKKKEKLSLLQLLNYLC